MVFRKVRDEISARIRSWVMRKHQPKRAPSGRIQRSSLSQVIILNLLDSRACGI